MSKTWSQKMKTVKVEVMKTCISYFPSSWNFQRKEKNVQNSKSKVKKGQSSFQVTFDVETKTYKGICPQNQIKFRRYKRSQKNSERTYIAQDKNDTDSYDEFKK